MVACDFLSRRIAPLQDHRELMWKYVAAKDPMRLSLEAMSPSVVQDVLNEIFTRPEAIPSREGAHPLFLSNGLGCWKMSWQQCSKKMKPR